MNKISRQPLNIDRTRQFVTVVLVLIFASLVGLSYFVISSIYAPLVIFGSISAIIIISFWFKKPEWVVFFTLFIVLLPKSLLPGDVNSYINRICTILAFVITILNSIHNRNRINITTSTKWMVAFIIWSAITLIWAENAIEGINIIQRYILRLILFLILIINVVKSEKELDGLMDVLALSGGLLVIVSIVTIANSGYSEGSRLQVLGVNENSLGIDLLICLPAVLWWSAKPNSSISPIKKWLAVIYLLSSLGLVGLSGSRGSMISWGITLLAFLLWKQTRFWGILALGLGGIVTLTFPILFSTTISRFLGAPGETILGGREALWPAGFQMIKDHLLLGIGIGNSPYQVIPYLSYIENIRISLATQTEASLHNPVMVILSETGVIGLLFYAGMLLSAIGLFVKQYFQTNEKRNYHHNLYFVLISSMSIGYMISWIKGGGMESDFSYFLIIALFLIPTQLFSAKSNI